MSKSASWWEAQNFFLFGKTVEEITALKQGGYRPSDVIAALPELQEALRLIEMGHFSNGDGELFRPLLDNLTGSDPFYVMADYADYLRPKRRSAAPGAIGCTGIECRCSTRLAPGSSLPTDRSANTATTSGPWIHSTWRSPATCADYSHKKALD